MKENDTAQNPDQETIESRCLAARREIADRCESLIISYFESPENLKSNFPQAFNTQLSPAIATIVAEACKRQDISAGSVFALNCFVDMTQILLRMTKSFLNV